MIFLGQNPGYNESIKNQPFIGASGQRLRQAYIKGVNLADLTSIYLCNTARCYTAPTAPPKTKEYRVCASAFLPHDLSLIFAQHTRVAIVCLGAPAAATLTWLCTGKASSQTAAFGLNGKTLLLPSGDPFTFFATYHPAACMRRRSYIDNVADHMELVRLWANADMPTASKPAFKNHQEIDLNAARITNLRVLQPPSGKLDRCQANPGGNPLVPPGGTPAGETAGAEEEAG